MINKEYQKEINDLFRIEKKLLNKTKYSFNSLVPSALPKGKSGIYLIANCNADEILYVGKTTNLQVRLYNNHLMGNKKTARLKKYLIEDSNMKNIKDLDDAKNWIKGNCYCKFIKMSDDRKRSLFEKGLAYLLQVKYIDE